MSATFKCSLGIALTLFAAASASADDPLTGSIVGPYFPGGYGYGYGYGYGFSQSGTAQESIVRGGSQWVRSVGERHRLDSEANINNAKATALRLDNAVKAQQARMAIRRVAAAERQLRHEQIHERRLMTMALSDADRILDEPSTANLETRAEARLRLARALLEKGRREHAVNWLKDITTEFANTPAAAEATQMLSELDA